MTPDKQAAPSEWVERGVELADEAARWAYKAGDHGNSALLERRDAELASLRAHLESREAEFQLLEKDIAEFREAIAIANERMDQQEALVKQLAEALERISSQCKPYPDGWPRDLTLADFGGNADDHARHVETVSAAAVGDIARAALAAYQEKT
jgi:small-conductance mechanosensitive channel